MMIFTIELTLSTNINYQETIILSSQQIFVYIGKSTPFSIFFKLSHYPIKVYTNKISLLIKPVFSKKRVLLVSGRIPFYFYKIRSISKEIGVKYTSIYVG
jgi:hypothetical protein